MNPDILLLDEPFASIDPTSRKQFIQILARLHQAQNDFGVRPRFQRLR